MPSLEFFRRTGLFFVPDFLDSKFIVDLCTAMEVAPAQKALVIKPGGLSCVDEDSRKVESTILAKEIRSDLKKRLKALIPQLEKHFKVQLGGCESPDFLIYRPSDFFTPHADGGYSANSNETRTRCVTAVIFLNRESPQPEEGTYGQGQLMFYGLLDGPRWQECGLPLRPEPGLLVAFPSNMMHEVTPVSHGQRLTVVTWYRAPEPEPEPKSETAEPAN
jgi:SM-20-related protein